MTLLTSDDLNDDSSTIFIDIDGVINPLDPRPINKYSSLQTPWTTFFLSDLIHGVWIRKLQDFGVKIIFASTWSEEIEKIAQFYKIHNYDLINFSIEANYSDMEHETWKLPCVSRFIEDFHPNTLVAWVDDELQSDAMHWSNTRKNTYAIRPNSNTGLNNDEMKDLEEFFKNGR